MDAKKHLARVIKARIWPFEVMKARIWPEERGLQVDIQLSVGLYYLDVLSDVKACFTFFVHGKYKYMACIISSILVNALVAQIGEEDGEKSAGTFSIREATIAVHGPATIAMKAPPAKDHKGIKTVLKTIQDALR